MKSFINKTILPILIVFISTLFYSCGGNSGGDPSSPEIEVDIITNPAADSESVKLDSNIILTFSRPMDCESVEELFSLSNDTTILDYDDGVITWNSEKTEMTFNPGNTLLYDVDYTISINGEANIEDGTGVEIDCSSEFHTEDFSLSASLDQGVYTTAGELVLSSNYDQATIVYTTDGTTPTLTNGSAHTGSVTIPIDHSIYIEAKAFNSDKESIHIQNAYIIMEMIPIVASGTITYDMTDLPDISVPSYNVTLSPYSLGKYEIRYDQWETVKLWGEDHGYTFIQQVVKDIDATYSYSTSGVMQGAIEYAYGQPRKLPYIVEYALKYLGNSSMVSASHPATGVNWDSALVWCNALSEIAGLTPVYHSSNSFSDENVLRDATAITRDSNNAIIRPDNDCVDWSGSGYRLPTEAEWVYAAKGGASDIIGVYPGLAGASPDISTCAWYGPNTSVPGNFSLTYNTTYPVGQKIPNELGLYDISGNVWEKMWNYYEALPSGSATDPHGLNYSEISTGTPSELCKGGSYRNDANNVRLSYRFQQDPAVFGYSLRIGFRVARVPQ